ncbi:FecR family protein [Larkinella bovis]|uniref:FecR family protein n=1 Tax=Larkinella bovis TaxID=683041 RepID=A0ABW0IL25_9BACT
MQKEEFVQLLARYNKGQCSEAEIRLIDQWYDRLGTESSVALSEEDRQKLKKKLWHSIDLQTSDDAETVVQAEEKTVRLPLFRGWAAAAAVITLIGLGALLFNRYPSRSANRITQPTVRADDFVTYTNTTQQPQTLTLEDSTRIYLQPQSTIRYAVKAHPNKRETWLKGKAFFQVHKDPKRPFLVYSGTIVTRVLGTSFWVTAPADVPTVEVAVHTGKVSVFKKRPKVHVGNDDVDETASVVLTPNQKVTIYVDEDRLTRGLIDQPEPIRAPARPVPTAFVFDDSPLPEVLQQLERAYGIEMEMSNEALNNCRFTGKIDQQSLYVKLELICRTLNLQYEVQGNRILITGSGCTP